MWATSRLLIAIVMLGVAPLLAAPPGGIQPEMRWETLAQWDGAFYRIIATEGYTDGPVAAFFPLFPLLMRLGTFAHLTPAQAGVLVNNGAFLAALVLLYVWVEDCYGQQTARWATAFLAWSPFSLFGSVTYTEGLFLVLTTGCLRAFDRRRYGLSGLCGALASACRLPGIVLLPTLAIVAWREKRPLTAYGAAAASCLGAVAYSAYCGWQFGKPLLFLEVQSAWNREQPFVGYNWLKLLGQIAIGQANWKAGGIVDPLHPLAFVALCGLAGLLWWGRSRWPRAWADGGAIAIGVLLWLLCGDPLINAVVVLGGFGLLLLVRKRLLPLLWTYGLASYGLIFGTLRTISIERFVFATIAMPVALALLLERRPRFGYAILGLSGIVLITYALRFARGLWVA